MIKFRPGVEVVTKEPFVVVAPGLELGMHRFRLVVVDDRGRISRPTFHYILLYKRKRPDPPKKDSGKDKKPKPPGRPKKEAGTEKKRKPATQTKKDPNKKPRKKIS